MPAPHLTVSVISPDGAIFEGIADMVVAPAWDGEVGILRGHAPMLVLLGGGELRVTSGRTVQRFAIGPGFLQVIDDVVSVLSERGGA
jgi:F-type H+-transporting ATPase subunit epsilon